MPKKILIADESSTVRSVSESVFRQHGYEVFSAEDGQMALRLARAIKPDILVLDVALPKIDGVAVWQSLQEPLSTGAPPTVFLVSKAEQPSFDLWKRLRYDKTGSEPPGKNDAVGSTEQKLPAFSVAAVNKPFTPPELLRAANGLLYDVQSVKAADSMEKPVKAKVEFMTNIENPAGQSLTHQERKADLDSGEVDFLDQVVGSKDSAPLFEEEQTLEELLAEGAIELELTDPAGPGKAIPQSTGEERDPTRRVSLVEPVSQDLPQSSDQSKIPTDKLPKNPKEPGWTSQGEIELADDQFGLHRKSYGDEEPGLPHDYDWFLTEMRKEAPEGTPGAPVKPQLKPEKEEPQLKVEAPLTSANPEELRLKVEELGTSRLGYERLLAEVKNIARQPSDLRPASDVSSIKGEIPAVTPREQGLAPVSKTTSAPSSPALPPTVGINSYRAVQSKPAEAETDPVDQLINQVSQQVAQEIVSAIDKEQLRKLIEQKILQQVKAEQDKAGS